MGDKLRKVLLCNAVLIAAAVAEQGFAGTASADTVLWVQGASPGEIPLAEVMKRVPPGYTLQQIDYPHGLWPWTGLFTATGASPPNPNSIASPSRRSPTPSARGLVSYIPYGLPVALTLFTVAQPVPVTPYDVSVIKLDYDGIASWPHRPWHLLADLNALMGGIVYHGTDHYGNAARQIINGTFPAQDITTEINSRGGVTTTYAAEQNPALTHLLEPILPQPVAFLNKFLTPIINLGYSEFTPNAGPHLAPGGPLVDKNGDPVCGRKAPASGAASSRAMATPRASARQSRRETLR